MDCQLTRFIASHFELPQLGQVQVEWLVVLRQFVGDLQLRQSDEAIQFVEIKVLRELFDGELSELRQRWLDELEDKQIRMAMVH